MNAYLGHTAAAATWPPPWRLFQQDHPKEAAQLKVIWETRHLVNNSVMARADLPHELVTAVREELLALSTTTYRGYQYWEQKSIQQTHRL